jgi:hypothetical protein
MLIKIKERSEGNQKTILVVSSKFLNVPLFLAAQTDHSDCDCFVLAVLSHGKMGKIYARDRVYKREILWTHFTDDKCPTLAGKPKLLFLQVK